MPVITYNKWCTGPRKGAHGSEIGIFLEGFQFFVSDFIYFLLKRQLPGI